VFENAKVYGFDYDRRNIKEICFGINDGMYFEKAYRAKIVGNEDFMNFSDFCITGYADCIVFSRGRITGKAQNLFSIFTSSAVG
jgi:hypothetical protein